MVKVVTRRLSNWPHSVHPAMKKAVALICASLVQIMACRITGSGNGLSPGQHQAIIWTSDCLLSPPTKSDGDIALFSVHPYVRPNNGFWPLFQNVLIQCTSNLACVLIGWVFRNSVIFGPVAKYFAHSGIKISEIWGFWTLTEKVFIQFNFKPCQGIYWVSVLKFFHFRPPVQILGLLLGSKWVKPGVSWH